MKIGCTAACRTGWVLLWCLAGPWLAVPRAHAIAGLEGTFEFGLDAPWRIEPSRRGDGALEYGAIPIQVTIHDAVHANLDDVLYAMDYRVTFNGTTFTRTPVRVGVHLPSPLVSLGRLHSIRVTELSVTPHQTVEFGARSLYEIETTAAPWPWPESPGRSPGEHQVCRVWNGDDPEPFRNVAGTSEWHAGLWYVPKNVAPGSYTALMVEVILQRDPWPAVKLPYSGSTVTIDTSPTITLRNYVRVYLAPEPLPRFDSRWLYGDLHYHAQGTDNEGEAGYNYRGVVRAMGAMGMDFAFATDHASSSEQLIDVDLPPIYDIPRQALGEDGHTLHEGDARTTGGVVRDMDFQRYALCHDIIYGTRGANRESSIKAYGFRWPQGYLAHGAMPQVFLGGEVDVIPEVPYSAIGPVPHDDHWNPLLFHYGNNLLMDLNVRLEPGINGHPYQLFEPAPEGGSYLVHDFQSLDSYQYYGREHLVYLPSSASLTVGKESSFVPSLTSKYGGATRRLDQPANGRESMLSEIGRKGVTFVAHHLNGTGGGSPGPEGVPWTVDHMLLKAFRSPAVLGLQFWNEDEHLHSAVCSHEFCRDGADGRTYLGRELGYERQERLDTDWLVDFLAFVTGANPPDYLAMPLEEVRHGFITGGAAGGLFELYPFDVVNGLWQEHRHGVEHDLVHGSFDWDQLNLRGLQLERNSDLTWLKPGEPRKMFMAGGSDAHGDLNYRRAGYFLGTQDATDTAIGKPRNLVFAGVAQGAVLQHVDPVLAQSTQPATAPAAGVPPTTTTAAAASLTLSPGIITPPIGPVLGYDIRAHSQEQVIGALQQGRFSVTDGPAIRMAIDMNGNGVIDDADVMMGDTLHLTTGIIDPTPGDRSQKVTVLTEVRSTAEFGPIIDLDLYVGVAAGARGLRSGVPVETRVYAPTWHGPVGYTEDAGPSPQTSYQSGGRTYFRMSDRYWDATFLGDTLTWNPVPGDPLKYQLTLATTLHLDRYQVGPGVAADRFFVRAYARTAGDYLHDIPDRQAFTNPVWIMRSEPVIALPPDLSLEKDDRGLPIIRFSGVLQSAPRPEGPFTDVPAATGPYRVPLSGRQLFYRSRF